MEPISLPETGVILRVFLSERDSFEGKPVYERIVLKARELNLAGATVIRGIMGYGADSRVHTAKILELSVDLPIIVEIVETQDKLNLLMPYIDHIVTKGMVAMENVRVIRYGPSHS